MGLFGSNDVSGNNNRIDSNNNHNNNSKTIDINNNRNNNYSKCNNSDYSNSTM